MRSVMIVAVCTALGFSSVAYASPEPTAISVGDSFAVSGIEVDATAKSPREARDLAIARGRAAAWSALFRRITDQRNWVKEPRLSDRELAGLVLRTDAQNERRNTTRYVADVTFHFNRTAVDRLLSSSNSFTDDDEITHAPASGIADRSTYVAVNVRFDSAAEWAMLRTRLSATNGVAGMDIVGHTAHDAQVYLSYSGDFEQLRSALAQSALQLRNSEGEYTLQLSEALFP